MRIVGGTLKGRRLTLPKKVPARPTTDFAKEGLFNAISHLTEIEGASVLDLFSGTGNISIEFLSREASTVEAVERNEKMIRVHKDNLRIFGLTQHIWRADTFKAIAKFQKSFDIVFADPPYDLPKLGELPKAVLQSQVLHENSVFVLEHGIDHNFSDHPNFFQHKKYGHVHFSFCRLN